MQTILPGAPGGLSNSDSSSSTARPGEIRLASPPHAHDAAEREHRRDRRLRIDVPGELSIAGFDDIPMAAWESFSLTSVRQPLTDMARDAARRLIARIEGTDESEPSRVVFPTHLVSAPPPPARRRGR